MRSNDLNSVNFPSYRFANTQSNSLWLPKQQEHEDSVLQYLNIDNTGILHSEKSSGAVEILFRNPRIDHISITNNHAHQSIFVLTSGAHSLLNSVKVKNSTGLGAAFFHASTSSTANQESGTALNSGHNELGFKHLGSIPEYTTPMQNNHLAINPQLFGVVDACSSEKVVFVDKRVLVVFRFSANSPGECVKTFRAAKYGLVPDDDRSLSRHDEWYYGAYRDPMLHSNERPYYNPRNERNSRLGFRLLQYSMPENLRYPGANVIRIFSGSVYNASEFVAIGQIKAAEGNVSMHSMYSSFDDTLSLSVLVGAANNKAEEGFIAEVFALPSGQFLRDSYNELTLIPAHIPLIRDPHLNLSDCLFSNNSKGAIKVTSVGENNPSILISRSTFTSNGQLLGPELKPDFRSRLVPNNFSTSYSAITLQLQNTPTVSLLNSVIRANTGGLNVISDSLTSASSLRAHIGNCIFEGNSIAPDLFMSGSGLVPYQQCEIRRNSFTTHRLSHFADQIVLHKVVGNISENYVSGNAARNVVRMIGFDSVR